MEKGTVWWAFGMYCPKGLIFPSLEKPHVGQPPTIFISFFSKTRTFDKMF